MHQTYNTYRIPSIDLDVILFKIPALNVHKTIQLNKRKYCMDPTLYDAIALTQNGVIQPDSSSIT